MIIIISSKRIIVLQVSVDHAGEYYVSCSDNGRMTGLYTENNTHNFYMDKSFKSISIGPIYARAKSGRRFMTGVEDKLILHKKVIFSREKQDILCQEERVLCVISSGRGGLQPGFSAPTRTTCRT